MLPVGRLTTDQMRGLAELARTLGDGDIRLTVWQNLLLSDIPDARVEEAKAAIDALGLDWRATELRAGLVACTGAAGCKFAAADTKEHALAIADHVEARARARRAGQHPRHRLPQLLRPALHRRHRPDRRQGRRSTTTATPSTASTSWSAAASPSGPHRPRALARRARGRRAPRASSAAPHLPRATASGRMRPSRPSPTPRLDIEALAEAQEPARSRGVRRPPKP